MSMGKATRKEAKDKPLPPSSMLTRLLEDEILNNTLKPGTRLDEQALANRFHVSRTPVREALRHLASSGLVEIRRNQGATVKRLQTGELIEMFQVMAELEGLCARLSARRMNAEECARLRELHDACAARASEGRHEQFFQANNEFHEVIYSGSRNAYLGAEIRKLANRLNVYRWYVTFQPRRMRHSVAEHLGIVEAIEAGEDEMAHRLMREHVDLLAGSAADVITALNMQTAI
jgi:DNA-binding GntR family transcriptional regulator